MPEDNPYRDSKLANGHSALREEHSDAAIELLGAQETHAPR